MDRQRFQAARIADGPHIVGRNGRDAKQVVVVRTIVRTRHDVPSRAVPVQRQRAVFTPAGSGPADGPYIVRGDGIDGEEDVIVNGGAGHDAPRRAVPMHRERMVVKVIIGRVTDRPQVVVRDGVNARERIGLRPRIWTSDNLPISARDWAADKQSEQDKSGCASDFHVVAMVNTKVRPRVLPWVRKRLVTVLKGTMLGLL